MRDDRTVVGCTKEPFRCVCVYSVELERCRSRKGSRRRARKSCFDTGSPGAILLQSTTKYPYHTRENHGGLRVLTGSETVAEQLN